MKHVTITVDKAAAYRTFDELLRRWTATPKMFPFDMKDAFIPQKVVPDELRKNKEKLARFYFHVCLYMRGGIKSLQAFHAMLRLMHDHPKLFDPFYAEKLFQDELQPIIAQYVGWDSEDVARFWIENAKRLVRNWDGKVMNLIKAIRSYDDAMLFIQNKDQMSKRERAELLAKDPRFEGFIGNQPKMVSMHIYFYDWEGLLVVRFVYASPADYHNFRIGLGQVILIVTPYVEHLRVDEDLSAPWREVVMEYIVEREVDPVELSDALWLFSLVQCGSSPLTLYKDPNGKPIPGKKADDEKQKEKEREKPKQLSLYGEEDEELQHLPHEQKKVYLSTPRRRAELKRTCLACPLLATCKYTIPAAPYYQRKGDRDGPFGGQMWLWEREPIEQHYDPRPQDYSGWTGVSVKEEMAALFSDW